MSKICLITGSTLGGAEYLAEHLAEVLTAQGYHCRIENNAQLSDVIAEKCWLVVTSTHGAGELPDNLKPLFEEITQQNANLGQLQFSVVGLGNSDYDTFCYAVNEVEKVLNQQGATQLCASLKIDVLNVDDPDQVAENWLTHFITSFTPTND